jgi:xylulokinase
MPDTILAIDIGLTNCKTVFFGLDGTILERESLPYPTYKRQVGWVEQEPQDWWQAVMNGVRSVSERNPAVVQAVCAISVTGHMHALVCQGAGGVAVGPSLVLGDQRSLAESDEIARSAGLDSIYHLTGARMDASMPMAKIAWLGKHQPGVLAQTGAFLACKDWLRSQLTGDRLTDPVDACGTSLYDLQRASWSPELVKLASIRMEQMPPIADPCSIAGPLLPAPAAALGLKAGIPVVVGAGDDVEVLGNGLMAPGASLEHLGTTGSILTCSDRLVYDPNMAVEVYPSAAPGLWVLGGSVTTAGLALEWAQQALGCDGLDDLTALDAEASLFRPRLDEPLIFVPHLSGERCPEWEPRARGTWCGLSTSHTQADLRQAVMEGIAFSLKTVLERIEGMAGKQSRITVGRRELSNPAWARLRASIYQCPLEVLNTEEPTALGAMMLAAVGIGVYPSLPEAVRALQGSCARVEPAPALADDYQRLYAFYLDAAEAQRQLMRQWQARMERA